MENRVIKRNGQEVLFNKEKIVNAIRKANAEVDPVHQINVYQIEAIAEKIANQVKEMDRAVHVEEIQDMVETGIMEMRGYEVAREYVRYRYKRSLARKANTTDDGILALIEQNNEEMKQENSNKNPVINSTQRDYIAGMVSRDITERILVPDDILEAHKEGIIHFHDMDYFIQKEHNCFAPDTKFITTDGIMAFKDFKDGEKITVLDKDGRWREATVRCYGIQPMQKVVLRSCRGSKEFICTPNHRWILEDETVTTRIKEGMKLYPLQGQKQNHYNEWEVVSIEAIGEKLNAWCVEEPVTHTFTLEGSIVTGNCDLINLEDMLQNGTVISETMIEKPHSFYTACNITTQIIAQVASNQYGGQTFTLAHLAPFVDISRRKIREQVVQERTECGENLDETVIAKVTEKRLKAEIKSGVQTIQYQLITLMTCNGQAPFVTMFMYLDEVPEGIIRDDLAMIIEEVLKQRIKGVKNESGAWVTPAFPKLIYVLDEDNIHEGSKYYYLTQLAAKCTAKRMVPDYISAKIMKELKGGDVYTCMGCRSFLTPDNNGEISGKVGNIANAGNYKEGVPKYYGRFNQGVVTINLIDVACSSDGDMDRFWEILEERLELCHRALRIRHERLLGTVSDVAPILWQNGALARLKKGETIDRLLYDGYSTISLGYVGLYEMCYRMIGKSHTTDEGRKFALSVMQKLNDKCKEWRMKENIAYSVYGTPIESTTYRFAKTLQRRFGIIPNVTDKNYITNSYHVHVTEEIDAFSKLKFEADFQELSPGGWYKNIA